MVNGGYGMVYVGTVLAIVNAEVTRLDQSVSH